MSDEHEKTIYQKLKDGDFDSEAREQATGNIRAYIQRCKDKGAGKPDTDSE